MNHITSESERTQQARLAQYFGLALLAGIALLALPSDAHAQGKVMQLSDGSRIRYALSVPPGYDGSEALPMILALHYGWGGDGPPPRGYGEGHMRLLVEPALRDLGAIIVAPDCPAPARRWSEPEAERAVMELVDEIRSEYRIDGDRVLVTGFSLGGNGSWFYATHHPDLFSAAIPMAGWAQSEWLEKLNDLPMYVIHARSDEVVPLAAAEEAVAAAEAKGVPVALVVVEKLTHYDTASYVTYLRDAVPWIQRIWSR
jgi:predicted peptidase